MRNLILFIFLIIGLSCQNTNQKLEGKKQINENDLISVEDVFFRKDMFVNQNHPVINFNNLKYNSTGNNLELPLLQGKEYQVVKRGIPDLIELDTVSIYLYSCNKLNAPNNMVGLFTISEIGENLYFLYLRQNGKITDAFHIKRGYSDLVDQTEEKEVIAFVEEEVQVVNENSLQIRRIRNVKEEFFDDEKLNKEHSDTIVVSLRINKEGRFMKDK